MTDQNVSPTNFHTRNVGAYVQFVPGGDKYFLGNCVDIDALPRPKTGGKEYDYCWNENRDGFTARNYALSTPGNTEFTISRFIEATASFLERINCQFSLYAVMSILNSPTTFGNWERAAAVHGCDVNEDSLTPLTHHVDDNPVMWEASIQAFPNRTDTHRLKVVTSGDPATARDITASALYGPEDCADYRFPIYGPGFKRIVAIAADVADEAEIWLSFDGGDTFTQTSADPFGVNIDVVAVAWFPIGDNTDRIFVFADSQAGVAMQGAYSDDGGATWTVLTIGTVLAEAPPDSVAGNNQAFFVSSYRQMFVVTTDGGLFHSSDGGNTWDEIAAIKAATGGGTTLNVVDFNGTYGLVTGDDAELFITTDEVNWSDYGSRLPAAKSGNGFKAAHVVNDKIFMIFDSDGAGATGVIYITWDEAVNWSVVRYTDDTNGVQAASFYNTYVGIIISNTSGRMYLTIDGGDEWFEIQNIPSAVKPFIQMASTISGQVASAATTMSIVQKY